MIEAVHGVHAAGIRATVKEGAIRAVPPLSPPCRNGAPLYWALGRECEPSGEDLTAAFAALPRGSRQKEHQATSRSVEILDASADAPQPLTERGFAPVG